MNELQLSLTRLIGKKELTFGCLYQIPGDSDIYKYVDDEVSILPNGIKMQNGMKVNLDRILIIGHPATLSDFHRWMNENQKDWAQDIGNIHIKHQHCVTNTIQYLSSKDLLDQSEETLKQIISLISSNQ